jgi:hypothetical protein
LRHDGISTGGEVEVRRGDNTTRSSLRNEQDFSKLKSLILGSTSASNLLSSEFSKGRRREGGGNKA